MLNIQGCTKHQQLGAQETRAPRAPPRFPWTYLPSCSGRPASSQSALQVALQTGSLPQPACHPDSNASNSASCVSGDPCLQPLQLLLETEPVPGPGSLPRQGPHLKEKVCFPSW